MMKFRRGKGLGLFENGSSNPSLLHDLSSICFEIKQNKGVLIENKHLISEPYLASITHSLRLHYQNYYGFQAKKPCPITIPHARIFEDFQVNGSLHILLVSFLEAASLRGYSLETIFDFGPDHILPLLFSVDKALSLVPVNLVAKLSKIVVLHGGELVDREVEASHVIDWADELDQDKPPEMEDFRIKASSLQTEVLVHWTFYPDSYNERFLVTEETSLNPFDTMMKTRYYLSCRFLLDCDAFNEWGNELDYEIPSTADEEDVTQTDSIIPTPGRGRGRGKRKSGVSVLQAKILKETFIPQIISSSERYFTEVLPLSLLRQEKSTLLAMDMTDVTNPNIVSYEGQKTTSTEPSNLSVGKRKREGDSNNISASSFYAEIEDLNWFSIDSISQVERRYLGSIISSSNSNEILSSTISNNENLYIHLRNAIINLYLLNKQQYLSATECRRKISGDISKIIKIHEFLDAFGLINQNAKLESCPRTFSDSTFSLTLRRKYIRDKMELALLELIPADKTSTHSVYWTNAMDESLLNSIVAHKMDWKNISHAVSQASSLEVISPYECMIRFVELALRPPSMSETLKTPLNEVSSNIMMEENPLQKGCQPNKQAPSHRIKGLCILLRAIEKGLREIMIHDGEMGENGFETLKGSVGIIEVISEVSRNIVDVSALTGQKIEKQNILFLQDYISTRVKYFESKLRVFNHLESIIQLEQDKTEVEKRENFLQKYHLSVNYGNSSNQGSSVTNATFSIPSSTSFSSLPNFK